MSKPRNRPGTPLWLRILADTDRSSDCWLWLRSTNPQGYGCMRIDGRTRAVHVVAYELWRGPVPVDLELDHLCRQRACCNPWHLDPVTHAENVRRGESGRVRGTHCGRGHAFDRWNGTQGICNTCIANSPSRRRRRGLVAA